MNVEKDPRGQVKAGSGVRSLSGTGMLAGGTEVEPPVVDPGNGTSGGEGGGGVQNVLG